MLCYHYLEILSKLNILENFYSLISGCAGRSVLCLAFSLQWLLLLGSLGSRARGLPLLHHLGSQLWLLVALWRVDPSSQSRGQAHVSGIGRRTLPLSSQGEAPLSKVFTNGPQVFILHGPRQFCSGLQSQSRITNWDLRSPSLGQSHAVSSMHSVGPELLVEKTSWGQGWLVAAKVEFGEDLSGWIWLQLGLSQNRSGKRRCFSRPRHQTSCPRPVASCPTRVLHVHIHEPKPTAGQGPAAGHSLIRAILVSL